MTTSDNALTGEAAFLAVLRLAMDESIRATDAHAGRAAVARERDRLLDEIATLRDDVLTLRAGNEAAAITAQTLHAMIASANEMASANFRGALDKAASDIAILMRERDQLAGDVRAAEARSDKLWFEINKTKAARKRSGAPKRRK